MWSLYIMNCFGPIHTESPLCKTFMKLSNHIKVKNHSLMMGVVWPICNKCSFFFFFLNKSLVSTLTYFAYFKRMSRVPSVHAGAAEQLVEQLHLQTRHPFFQVSLELPGAGSARRLSQETATQAPSLKINKWINK